MPPAVFQKRLLAWYKRHARHDLPWRQTRDPYRILVSEIMLQQTQVKKVIPYYDRFLKRFPSVFHLAKAPLPDVLEGWSGLGYYHRAKNLHAAAKRIVSSHAGSVPSQPSELLALPGIGRYTAGAVASIAFDLPVPIVDGNVARVLARYRGVRDNPGNPIFHKKLWEISSSLVPKISPGIFNQALMELGALLCTPRAPQCSLCPVQSGCFARAHHLEEKLPVPKMAPARKKITYLCGILERRGKVLIARRPMAGLLPGLWEFPGGEKRNGDSDKETLHQLLRARLGIRVSPTPLPARVRQILTHRVITIRPFRCSWKGSAIRTAWYQKIRWIPKEMIGEAPLTSGMRRMAQAISFSLLVAFLAGCATIGPAIDQADLKNAQEFYEVKSRRHSYAQTLRLRTVGEHLLSAVPQKLRPKNPKPAIGIVLDDLTLVSGRTFAIPGIEPDPKARGASEKGCLIVGVLPDSPASQVHLESGDLLVKVGSEETPTVQRAVRAFSQLKPNTHAWLLIEREGVRFEREILLGEKPYPVSFNPSDEDEVNAYASPGQIVVTSGLLRFIRSDDELAVVMGHELAHLTQGHYAKRMGTDMIAGTIGTIAGMCVDIALPGIGSLISRLAAAGIRAPFSKDFEREADYVGLWYAHHAGYKIEAGITFWDRFATELPQSLSRSFFNTHPTSPERLLRLQKTIEMIKEEGAFSEAPPQSAPQNVAG